MANVKAQVPNKATEVQADAAAANSVPELRTQVVKLAEDLEQLRAIVSKLTRTRRKPS